MLEHFEVTTTAGAQAHTPSQPVILLHGFLGSGRNLTSVARRLVEVHPELRIVLPDLTGHGESPPLPPGADLETLASDVLQLGQSLSLPAPWILIGHSQGGRTALEALRHAPDRISRVVLLDIAPGPIVDSGSAGPLRLLNEAPASAPDRETFRAHFRNAGLSAGLTEWLLMNLVRDDQGQLIWRFDRAALAALHPRVNAADLWPVVEQYGDRIRCIRGGRAPYVSDEDVRRFEENGCRVDTIADAGHFLHVDRLDELIALLKDL